MKFRKISHSLKAKQSMNGRISNTPSNFHLFTNEVIKVQIQKATCPRLNHESVTYSTHFCSPKVISRQNLKHRNWKMDKCMQ